MCGIVAIFGHGKPVNPETLTRATNALAHRGPDDQRIWLSPDGNIGLGHARLTINDPEAYQPIASEDGRLQIVVNGEFYDHHSLRRDLTSRGHHFRTRGDSEVALHLFEQEGKGCLRHLRGEFAFAIWDAANKTLFAARDRFGIKPLFYAETEGQLIIASEAKALFAAGIPNAWDEESVFQSLFATHRPDRSLFKNVHQLPAGHFMLATSESKLMSRYWDVPYPRTLRKPALPDERVTMEQVRTLLNESVRLRMQADVPVGCLLSGGLDSSTLLGLASIQATAPVKAFTISFEGADYDESEQARDSASYAGVELEVIRASTADMAACLSDSAWHGESIQYNAHGTARFLLSRAVQASGYKAVLAGEGADELFIGYRFAQGYMGSLGNRRSLLDWPVAVIKALGPLNESERLIAQVSPWLARVSRLVGFPEGLVDMAASLVDTVGSIVDSSFMASFAGHDPFRAFLRNFDIKRDLLGREPAKQLMYLWLRSVFVNYHMAADRLDMAHGVEVRLPYLDHKLFEQVSKLPIAAVAKGGSPKGLLREAARPYIINSVWHGQKKPFFAPPHAIQPGNPLFEVVQDILRDPIMKSIPFFNHAAVVTLLDQLPTIDDRRRKMLDPLIMVLVSMRLLHERFRL